MDTDRRTVDNLADLHPFLTEHADGSWRASFGSETVTFPTREAACAWFAARAEERICELRLIMAAKEEVIRRLRSTGQPARTQA